MKFEFSAAIKAVPMADIRLSIDCTADELSIMLSDPAYQGLAEALIAKIQQSSNGNRKVSDNRQQNHGNDRFDHMRKVYEVDRKAQQSHNEAVDTAIKNMQDQLNRMFNRVINNSSITKF